MYVSSVIFTAVVGARHDYLCLLRSRHVYTDKDMIVMTAVKALSYTCAECSTITYRGKGRHIGSVVVFFSYDN